MGINEIFINKRKINKKEGVYQVHISAANFLRALKMVQIESKDNALHCITIEADSLTISFLNFVNVT